MVNRCLGSLLRILASSKSKEWDLALSQAKFAYNQSKNRTTRLSPFEVVYSQNPLDSHDLAPVPRIGRLNVKAKEMAMHLQEVHYQVKQGTKSKQAMQSIRFKAKNVVAYFLMLDILFGL